MIDMPSADGAPRQPDSPPAKGAVVHPTAIVEPGAVLGEGTRVWHHAHVRSGAVVGEGCVLGKNVYVAEGARIGNRCKVENNVSVFSGVTLEDEVFVGPGVAFTNDLYPRASSTDWVPVGTLVRTGASIGANATVVCGIVIGEWATIAAGAVVTRTVDPHRLVAGCPARPVGTVCVCGRVVSRGEEPPIARCACGRPGWEDGR